MFSLPPTRIFGIIEGYNLGPSGATGPGSTGSSGATQIDGCTPPCNYIDPTTAASCIGPVSGPCCVNTVFFSVTQRQVCGQTYIKAGYDGFPSIPTPSNYDDVFSGYLTNKQYTVPAATNNLACLSAVTYHDCGHTNVVSTCKCFQGGSTGATGATGATGPTGPI